MFEVTCPNLLDGKNARAHLMGSVAQTYSVAALCILRISAIASRNALSSAAVAALKKRPPRAVWNLDLTFFLDVKNARRVRCAW